MRTNRSDTAARYVLGAVLLLVPLAACGDAGEEAPPAGEAVEAPADAPAEPTAAPADSPMLDPDAASREALLGEPGIDEATADAIIAGRPWADMLAVDAVLAERLSEEQRDSVYTRLWKPIDINTASEEEILLIPGVGPTMAHEFEEYRPWRAVIQFRREIGKYVDDAEVARLERYVRIPDGAGGS